MMNDLQKKLNVNDIYILKLKYIKQAKELEEKFQELEKTIHEIGQSSNIRIERMFDRHITDSKFFDKKAWAFLAYSFDVKKFMLCSEWDKLQHDVESGNVPEFTIENAQSWLNGLNISIVESVNKMLDKIYDNICNGFYLVGKVRKKRNNNGIDKNFILYTNDYKNIFLWGYNKNTVTDDLEKVCYILDGKQLPPTTIKEQMRYNKLTESSNDYFTIKVYKNGNTHYTLSDEIKTKLNKILGNRNAIGTDFKIKVF